MAGEVFPASVRIKASDWLTKIGYSSKAIIVGVDGLPFVKDISKRWGKYLMDTYFKERDEFRFKDGKNRIWTGTNMALAKLVIGKNNSLAEGAAVQRAGLDKTWRWNWAREGNICLACNVEGGDGIGHPIWRCNNPLMVACRTNWVRKVRVCLDHIPPSHRTPLEELWRNMEHGEGGEFACCGVFQPRFIRRLTRADDVLSSTGKKLLVRIIKEVGRGARGLLKLHTEINLPVRVKALRQPSIKSFMVKLGKSKDLDPIAEGQSLRSSQGHKRKTKRSRYVNPVSESSDDEDVTIRNPPLPGKVFSRHIEIKSRAGQVTYWEWKAG